MLKNYFVIFSACSCFFSSTLFGLTLKESVVEAIETNPTVQERIKNYRATQQDLNIAESGYYPTIDLRAASNKNSAGEVNTKIDKLSYTNYETSLILTQNIFDGFSTVSRVDQEEARVLASAYNYVEKVNSTAFDMTNAYINVLRAHELLAISKENVEINENMLLKVKDLFESGLTTDSEVKKIQSTLSLSLSNLIVQKNNTLNAEYNFRKILGRMPNINNMQKPDFNISMPGSIERAALYSVENNPTLLVSKYNIKSAQAQYKERKKGYYPRIDLELTQLYNKSSMENNGFDRSDDRFRASVVLNYNLFRGGADRAEIQKQISNINKEIEVRRDLKRQVIENLDISWSSYEMIEQQLEYLRQYSQYSEKTLKLYEEEYDLGRRSLLDLLSSQNDFINSRSQIIRAEYDYLLAKYRILDSMGLLVLAITGDENRFKEKVNLYGDDAHELLDSVEIELDVDKDNISDNLDLCDNSLKENNIMPYGCMKAQLDSDGDGVFDLRDECPSTVKGAKVSSDGCAVDTDKDGFKDYEDSCPNTPLNVKVDNSGCGLDSDLDGVKDYEDQCRDTPVGYSVNEKGCPHDDDNDGVDNYQDECPETPNGYKVDSRGCSVSISLNINFGTNSSVMPEDSNTSITELSTFLKKNTNYHALIIGHANNLGSEEYNMNLSIDRAKSVMEALKDSGIAEERMRSEGRGETEPLANNESKYGRNINRRVEIELTQEDIRGNNEQ